MQTGRGHLRCGTALCVCLAFLVAPALAQSVTEDQNLFMPGSQQGSATVDSVTQCDNCHAGYDTSAEPVYNWRGSMMANAARDPLWIATMAVALQDSKHALGNFNAGDLCIRCHSPRGWLGGRSEPTNGTALTGADFEGVTCDFCHRMVDPFPALEQRDRPAETGSAAITAAATTYSADITALTPLKLFDAATPFLDSSTELPTHYGTGSLPDYIEAAGGQYFVDASGPKRGPRLDANPPHQFNYSRFHRSRYFCATCHDVSNPVVGSIAGGAGTPEEQAAASYGHVERTFSEFRLSAFGQNGGAQTADKIGVGVAANCQDCHMHDVTGALCNKNVPTRSDMALHDMTGGNVWMSTIFASVDKQHASYDSYNYDILSGTKYGGASVEVAGLQDVGQELLDGAARAQQQLLAAADLVLVSRTIDSLTLRVVNNTGHKLISGYPEGRRIWLNVVFSGDAGVLAEINPYSPLVKTTDGSGNDVYVSGAELTKTNDELVWEANMASTITGESKTFHFVLADGRYKDNRIPPKGFDIASAPARMVVPVWHGVDDSAYFSTEEYDGGYDEVTVSIPAGTTSATATLYYQTTSKEYMEFLRSEINGTATTLPETAYIAQSDTFFSTLKDWGEAMWDLWVHNGASAPIEMVSTTIEICGEGNETPVLGDYPDTSMQVGSSTTVNPAAAPSDDGSVNLTVEASEGFTGTLSVSSVTGVVSIGDANAGTYVITVTATDNCGATATKTFSLEVTLPAPSTVVAAATSTSSVSVTWGAVTGAASYHVYRNSGGPTWSLVGSSSGTSLTDSTVLATTAYLYKVRAFDGAIESGDSAVDLATTVVFTDPVLTPGVTKAKAVHITELRTAVNAVRQLASLNDATFTDAGLAQGFSIKRVHVTELRALLDDARSSLGLTGVSYSDPVITSGETTLMAVHLQEIRDGVK